MLPVNLPKKRTLIKDRVGCCRVSTYNLPNDPNHTYGLQNTREPVGTGEIISNWAASNPSAGKESTRSYVHSNALAVKNGCVTAQSMRQYCEAHPNIRLKEVMAEGGIAGNANHEGPFGIQTKFAEESIKDIIQAKFTDMSLDDADYPDTSNIMKMSSFPKPIPTKASQILVESRKKEFEKSNAPQKKFCMKKFQNIPAKLHLPGPHARSKAAADAAAALAAAGSARGSARSGPEDA